MTADHGASALRAVPGLVSPAATDVAWARERDQRFASFMVKRLAEVKVTGCGAEQKALAGVEDVFAEWLGKREIADDADHVDEVFNAQIRALGWALRCVAHGVWHRHPKWELAFHPSATVAPLDMRQLRA